MEKKMSDLPVWIQELWDINPELARKAEQGTSNIMEQNDRLNKAMLDSARNLIQFVAVELRGGKLSDEDIESMIHDYVHLKKETKKE